MRRILEPEQDRDQAFGDHPSGGRHAFRRVEGVRRGGALPPTLLAVLRHQADQEETTISLDTEAGFEPFDQWQFDFVQSQRSESHGYRAITSPDT